MSTTIYRCHSCQGCQCEAGKVQPANGLFRPGMEVRGLELGELGSSHAYTTVVFLIPIRACSHQLLHLNVVLNFLYNIAFSILINVDRPLATIYCALQQIQLVFSFILQHPTMSLNFSPSESSLLYIFMAN